MHRDLSFAVDSPPLPRGRRLEKTAESFGHDLLHCYAIHVGEEAAAHATRNRMSALCRHPAAARQRIHRRTGNRRALPAAGAWLDADATDDPRHAPCGGDRGDLAHHVRRRAGDRPQAAGRPTRTGVVIAHQTFGDMLRWNPHFQAIVLEGGFDDQGTFVYIPLGHLQAMTELLRRRVVALLVDQKLLDRRFARNMLSWRHSGFSVDNSVRILDRGVQRSLAEYISRPAISAQGRSRRA